MTRATARQAMIEAAERLITERGMQALTLEHVQIAANQSNKSAAKYHSGSRHSVRGPSSRCTRRRSTRGGDEQSGWLTVRMAIEAQSGP
ncbi:RecA-family ATPase [Rhodococcus sp. LBL1]|nr:RecA-family ATPase [Rhodococcus sp. LBL1]MDH6682133.1 RecA-family ATPase [Rhodococcus sp. LBL2]